MKLNAFDDPALIVKGKFIYLKWGYGIFQASYHKIIIALIVNREVICFVSPSGTLSKFILELYMTILGAFRVMLPLLLPTSIVSPSAFEPMMSEGDAITVGSFLILDLERLASCHS